MARTKGMTALAIVLLVLSSIYFLTYLGGFIGNILTMTHPVESGLYDFGMTEAIPPTIFSWFSGVIGTISSVLILLGSVWFLFDNVRALPYLIFGSVVMVVVAALGIADSLSIYFNQGEVLSAYSLLFGQGTGLSIAFYVYLVLFWGYCVWYFSRDDLKSQFLLKSKK